MKPICFRDGDFNVHRMSHERSGRFEETRRRVYKLKSLMTKCNKLITDLQQLSQYVTRRLAIVE